MTKVYMGVLLISSLFSCDESIFPGWMKLLRREFLTVEFLLDVFRYMKRVQSKPLPAFVVFQVPTALENNQYTKVAYFGVACPELLQSHFGVEYSTTLHVQYKVSVFSLP